MGSLNTRSVSLLTLLSTNLLLLIVCHEDSGSVRYDISSFEENVGKNPHFVMFFAPWCGHCKRLSPTWEELAEKYDKLSDNKVIIAKVDCTTETSLCSSQDVTGYPTLKFFKPNTSPPIRYKGGRDLESLEKFIKEQMEEGEEDTKSNDVEIPLPENGLVELTSDNFHAFTEYGYHFVKFYAPWCGHCQSLAPVWKALADSLQHDGSVGISKVDCTAHRAICQEFEVKGYPTLIWIQDGKKIKKYQGSRTHEALKEFVDEMKRNAQDKDTVVSDDGRIPSTDISPVVQLTADNFDNGVEVGATFVKFYAPWCGHCKRLAPTWDELGVKFVSDANIKIAKVDCTLELNKKLCKDHEVEGYPTLHLFKSGKKVEEYKGPRDLESLYNFVINHGVREEL